MAFSEVAFFTVRLDSPPLVAVETSQVVGVLVETLWPSLSQVSPCWPLGWGLFYCPGVPFLRPAAERWGGPRRSPVKLSPWLQEADREPCDLE